NLYAVYAWPVARGVGLDAVRSGLEYGRPRHRPEVRSRCSVPAALHRHLRRHGMDCTDRDTTALASHAGVGMGMAGGRRAGVHGRSRVLRVRPPDPLRPFRVAYLCARRDGLSFLRGALVRGLTATGDYGDEDLEGPHR